MWLVFSDLHLDNYKAFATISENGLNSRLMQQIEVVREIKRICRRKHVTKIFFLGDLFNSLTANISKLLYNVAFYLVKSLSEVGQVYLMAGNHDQYRGVHMFTPFESVKGVTVIHGVTTVTIGNKTIDFVPWLEVPPEKKGNYCFGHFGVRGATVGNGITIETDELDSKLLQGYQLTLTGHYHTRQQVGKGIYQIGSAMSNSFADTTEDKGVWLLDPGTDKLSFQPIKSPKFITIELLEPTDGEVLLDKLNPDTYYKIIVRSDGISVPTVPPNVIVEYDFNPSVVDEVPVDTTDPTNLAPIIRDFIDKSNTALDKERLKQVAVELLNL